MKCSIYLFIIIINICKNIYVNIDLLAFDHESTGQFKNVLNRFLFFTLFFEEKM